MEEVEFYNTDGEEISLSNIVEQMINYYQLKLEVGETKLTDFNEGSEIRNLLEAFAVGIYALLEEQSEATKIAFIQTSYGEWLDKIGELPFIDLPRIEGSVSTGSVKFSIESALTEDYVIPAETILSSTDTGLDFETTSDSIIYAGDTSCVGIVECLTTGADGNVPIGSIDTIDDDTVDTELVSVTNEAALENGEDYEEDDEYRERLLSNVQAEGFGTMQYYKRLGEDVDGVHDVKLVSDASYTRKVLVNGYTKPVSDAIILDVLAEYSDLTQIVLGHSFIVDKVSTTNVSLTISLNVATTLSTTDLTANLTKFFDGGAFDRMEYTGLNIDESVSKDALVNVCKLFDDVVEVTSIKDGSNNDVTILEPDTNKVLKLSSVTWNQTEV